MSRRVTLLFFAVVAAQVIGLVVFAGVRQAALTQGREVTLQTVPVDPRSLLQGDYAILDYEIAALPDRLRNEPAGNTVYVLLHQCGDVWCADPSAYTGRRPDTGQVFIRGAVNDRRRLDFNIGTYFIPEGTGHIIESASDVKVIISLSPTGQAVIKDVLVDGIPFNLHRQQSQPNR